MCECVFCNKEKIVTDFVYEDELVMAFMDMEPVNEGHVLLVPKQHYLDVDEMPDELLAHLMIVSKKVVKALKEIYHPNGYSIMQNGGGFNDVGHYHLHIFPRYEGDGFGWIYGSEKKDVNPETAERIRKQILEEAYYIHCERIGK
ncbi:MAG: HIT family protein [Lachnospiraceae bacterium]|nr:HIT family protein [Lachnospiraceae bacterium]